MIDWSSMWEAGGVILAAVGSAIAVARHEVKSIVRSEIAAHEEREIDNMKPVIDSVVGLEGRMDAIQSDVSYIRGYLDRGKEKE